MESPEPIVVHEEVATSSNVDPINDKSTSIIKGKRTKRHRPQSPISFCLNLNDNNNDNNNNNTPESEGSRNDIRININTETLLSDDCDAYKTKEDEDEDEEEDIANCLILLAQGQPRYLGKNSSYNDDYYKQPAEQKKFTSKKFLETPYGDKPGYYVYECKTCFKTFPSFQALGGHRASHVKPKKEDNNNLMSLVDEGKTHSSPPKTNLNGYDDGHNHMYNSSNNKKKPRIHECSTCGAEFLSGQALGGHMRRHRTPGGARVSNVNGGSRHDHDDNYSPQLASSLLPSTLPFMTSMDHNGRPPSTSEEAKLGLNLDLNLAAPVEDESSKIHSTTTSLQQ